MSEWYLFNRYTCRGIGVLGYDGDGETGSSGCKDVDECNNEGHVLVEIQGRTVDNLGDGNNCHEDADCTNVDGGFICQVLNWVLSSA